MYGFKSASTLWPMSRDHQTLRHTHAEIQLKELSQSWHRRYALAGPMLAVLSLALTARPLHLPKRATPIRLCTKLCYELRLCTSLRALMLFSE